MIQQMLAIWSLVLCPFLNPAWISAVLQHGFENIQHYFASVWDECNCVVVWAFFGIAFLWDWNENWPFPVLWPLLSFPNLLACWVVWSLGLGQKWKTWLVFTPLGLLVGYLSSLSMSRVHLGLLWESRGLWRSEGYLIISCFGNMWSLFLEEPLTSKTEPEICFP